MSASRAASSCAARCDACPPSAFRLTPSIHVNTSSLRRAAFPAAAVVAVGLTLTLIALTVLCGPRLNWRTTDRLLREAMNGEVRFGQVVLHYPARSSERSVDELVAVGDLVLARTGWR